MIYAATSFYLFFDTFLVVLIFIYSILYCCCSVAVVEPSLRPLLLCTCTIRCNKYNSDSDSSAANQRQLGAWLPHSCSKHRGSGGIKRTGRPALRLNNATDGRSAHGLVFRRVFATLSESLLKETPLRLPSGLAVCCRSVPIGPTWTS